MSTNVTKMRVKGVVYTLNGKLYNSTGSNTDGSMTQAVITSELTDAKDMAESALAIAEQVREEGTTTIEGNVTNNPDEEDLTTVINAQTNLGELKLKNRAYVPVENSKGYVILRKNNNFSSQLTQTNTVYEIRYNFDLNGGIVEIPENCTLKFNGGSISNGTLVGSETYIDAIDENILIQITIGGTWSNEIITDKWFNDANILNINAIMREDVYQHIYMTKDYICNALENTGYLIPLSNTYIHLIGSITSNLTITNHRLIFIYTNPTFESLKNITIDGERVGKINGNRSLIPISEEGALQSNGKYKHTENGIGIAIRGNIDGVTIKNLEIYECHCDGIYAASGKNIIIQDCYIHGCIRQGISICSDVSSVTNSENVLVKDCRIENIVDYENNGYVIESGPGAAIDIEPNRNGGFCKNISIENITLNNCVKGIQLDASRSVATGESFVSNVRVCNIKASNVSSYLLSTYSKAENITIENITVEHVKYEKDDNASSGLFFMCMYAKNILLNDVDAVGIGNGCVINGSTDILITNSTISCIRLFFSDSTDNENVEFKNCRIDANNISNSHQAISGINFSLNYFNIISTDGFNTWLSNTIFKDNYITGSNIRFGESNTSNVLKNIIFENNEFNITRNAQIIVSAADVLFANNTFFCNNNANVKVIVRGIVNNANIRFIDNQLIDYVNNYSDLIYDGNLGSLYIITIDGKIYDNGSWNYTNGDAIMIKRGLLENIPDIESGNDGVSYYATDIQKNCYIQQRNDKFLWADSDGYPVFIYNYEGSANVLHIIEKQGPLSDKPICGKVGMRYFETTNNQPIYIKSGTVPAYDITLSFVDNPTYTGSINEGYSGGNFVFTFENVKKRIAFQKTNNVGTILTEIFNALNPYFNITVDTENNKFTIIGNFIGSHVPQISGVYIYSTYPLKLSASRSAITRGSLIWVDEEGVDVTNVSTVKGTTVQREALTLAATNEGLRYYDTTLKKYVLWNGTQWTNLDGTALS